MRKRSIVGVAVCLLVFGVLLWAEEGTLVRSLSSRFEEGLPEAWEIQEGTWTVEGGVLTGVDGFLISSLSFPTDRRIEARVEFPSGAERAIIVGKYASEQWVKAFLAPDGRTAIVLFAAGEERSWTAEVGPLAEGWHELVLGFAGSRAVFFVDGKKAIEAESPAIGRLAGKAGLGAEGQVLFDDVCVTSFPQPAIITSLGQSPGALMAKILAKKAGLEFLYDPRLKSDALEGTGTLLIVLGASSKGLGAAGIDVEDEITRGHALLNKARELGIPVIMMHIEGSSRRGKMSDRLIKEFIPLADYVVVKADGNADGLFTELTLSHDLPLRIVEKTAQVAGVLKDLFGLWE